ncbi:hypothetical protein Dda_7509 [Drechslerella dactyloides]|uniref:Suppressor of anucleate metulae protein B n=1 Tax=Drechslerella dactyloides TaxID=74499 RepID=A0AAD6ISR8_DREDA|nr:hypothetical protein Dda_7509 [Drechslerella dactyloides]
MSELGCEVTFGLGRDWKNTSQSDAIGCQARRYFALSPKTTKNFPLNLTNSTTLHTTMAIPTFAGAAPGSKKRKRVAVDEPTRRPKSVPKDVPTVTKAVIVRPAPKSKKAAAPPSDDDDDDDDSESGSDDGDSLAIRQAEMLQLEEDIIAATTASARTKCLNTLLDQMKDESEDVAIMTAVGLCRTFCRLMSRGQLVRHKDHTPEQLRMVKETKEAYISYLKGLGHLLESGEGTSLKLAMRLLKEESVHMKPSEEYYFPNLSFGVVIKHLLLSDSPDLVTVFATEYIYEYSDLRFEFLKAIPTISRDIPGPNTTYSENLFSILYNLKDFPTAAEELADSDLYISPPSKKKHPLFQIMAHQRYFQETWLALLSRPLPSKQRDILTILPKRIIPHLPNPRLLMDYLTDTYNSGGVTALLALQGLFNLMMSHNLDYPNFFPKLYALLDRDLMHVKYRSRFFRLLESFLNSSHLPAILVASFIKRMARLCLSAPPSAIVAIIPFVYNLMRLHPTCTFMLHRVLGKEIYGEKMRQSGFEDPFNETEEDPMKTGALESCLWELETLQSHYHPNVATLAKILSEQFTKQQYNTEDFLDHSYTSMLEAEMTKRINKDPVVEYIVPKKIFSTEEKQDSDGSLSTENMLLEFWDFECFWAVPCSLASRPLRNTQDPTDSTKQQTLDYTIYIDFKTGLETDTRDKMTASTPLSESVYIKDHKATGRGAFSSVLIPGGTEILNIPDPLICIPDNAHLDSCCHYCMAEATDDTSAPVNQAYKPSVQLSYCLGCKVVKYCSKACQTSDWKRKGHSYECTIYKAQYPRILPTTARAILRMAKLFLTETIPANKVGGIGALKSHITEFEKAGGERWENANLTAKATAEFSKASKKASFEAEFMRDLYCKLLVNSIATTTQSFDPIGTSIDYQAAMFNHSCDPNAIVLFDGRQLFLRSLREIPKDTEITISYIDTFTPRSERIRELSTRYFFNCSCSFCSTDPQPLESWLCKKCSKSAPLTSNVCPSCDDAVPEERLTEAAALAMSISTERQKSGGDKSIATMLKSLRSLYATGLLPSSHHPIPQLHQDLATAYIDAGDWSAALRHLIILYVRVFPMIYATTYHPLRVVRTFTLAMVLIQVAVGAPEGFGDVDYTKLLYGLLVEVCGNVDKSHGEESGFAKMAKRKMQEVMVDIGIDSNREADKWMGKGLRGVPGLEEEVTKISKIADGFVAELSEGSA